MQERPDPLELGWRYALPAVGVLLGLAGVLGAADLPRRGLAALMLAGAVVHGIRQVKHLRTTLRSRPVLPRDGRGRAVAAGAVVLTVGAVAAVSAPLLEEGTWLVSVLAAAFAVLAVGVGSLATWCLVREVRGTSA